MPVSYTHLRAHETSAHLVCRLLLEKKKVADCDRRVKPFPFLQKQTLFETKNFMCYEYIKNCVKTFLKHQSLSVRQKVSSLHTTFTPGSITTSAYDTKIYSSKTMFHSSERIRIQKSHLFSSACTYRKIKDSFEVAGG